ncbi:unnamed protein product [Orchesella dallaii]|uniref:Uncharacterized protein n=1 Tax=Orchesella dallaii TaxID=48710 RepID=A0ABP1S0R3_9HEXA
MSARKGATNKRQVSPVLSENDDNLSVPVPKKSKNAPNLPVKAILDKLDEIQKSNNSLKTSVEKVEKNVSECRDSIKQSIEDMRAEFQNRFSDHEERFEDLESRTKGLDKDMEQIYLDQERMYIAINKLNLILLGLNDQQVEHPDQLFEKVIDELKVSHQDAVCDIKKVFRVGKFKTDQTRPVKIIFGNINARDAIYDGRKNLEKPLNLNEDLPFTVRMDHKKLLKIRYDAITENPQELVLLHLHKRQIIIGKKLIKIIHGNRTEETLTPTQIQQYQPPKRDRIRNENPEGQRTHETNSNTLQTTRHLFHNNTSRSEATSHTAVPGSSTTEAIRPTFLESQRNQQQPSSRSMNPWM